MPADNAVITVKYEITTSNPDKEKPCHLNKVLGITAMTAMLGKKQFNAILGDLITKPQGKPTLVLESDKRPAMTTIIDDFKEDN